LRCFVFASTKNSFESGRRWRRRFINRDWPRSEAYFAGSTGAVENGNFDGPKNAI